MKILFVMFIFVIFLVPVFFGNSFGQTVQSQKPTSKIFMEMQLYDKDGHLYGYIQPVLQIFDMDRTIVWIASHATNSSVVYQGHRYLLMKFQDTSGESHFEQLGGYFLNVPVNGQMINVFYAYHDSFLMDKGDIQKIYWQALIPSV
jgi:hypothetical protein